ncbi:hypothetical protein Celaphus_00018962, partial [Cervus elaphus hippelaphus]
RCKGTFQNMPDSIGWKMTWLKPDDLTSLMDFGLINDETNPEADNLEKGMYGFGF